MKRYLQFLKEYNQSRYEYGCVMIDFPVNNWNELANSIINREDFYTGGGDVHDIQKYPHLTLLYPVMNNVKFQEIEKVLKGVVDKKIKIEIDKIDYFENSEFDVVKFNIKENDYLNKIHNELKTHIPNDDKYDIYRPHITISFVNKGSGIKYLRDYKFSFEADKILYTKSGGLKYIYNI
jgi:2'-5' RNA ligase